jgi:hypothetical protein
MFSTMLICVGVLLVASGAIAVGLNRSVAAQAAHLLGRPVVPIAQAADDGSVRIDWAIAAGEQGTLIAPCSGETPVWFRLRLRKFGASGGGDGGGTLWLTVADEQYGTVFHVDDGSGAYAQVNTNGAHVMARVMGFRELPLGAHDRVRAFLEGRGDATWIADAYEEECLRPGDRVTVAGRARRELAVVLGIATTAVGLLTRWSCNV